MSCINISLQNHSNVGYCYIVYVNSHITLIHPKAVFVSITIVFEMNDAEGRGGSSPIVAVLRTGNVNQRLKKH